MAKNGGKAGRGRTSQPVEASTGALQKRTNDDALREAQAAAQAEAAAMQDDGNMEADDCNIEAAEYAQVLENARRPPSAAAQARAGENRKLSEKEEENKKLAKRIAELEAALRQKPEVNFKIDLCRLKIRYMYGILSS